MTCACGCGRETSLARRNRPDRAQVKGAPMRFVPGHSSKCLGGRILSSQGYVLVATGIRAGSASKRYITEHILVAERALGKALPRGVVIHHVDEDRTNNAPSNLVVCENSAYHSFLHARARAYRATGNAKSQHCVFCKQWGLNLVVTARRAHSYHAACFRNYHAERRRNPEIRRRLRDYMRSWRKTRRSRTA